MASVIDIIGMRHSIRAYDGREIERDKKNILLKYLEGYRHGPFGNEVRFEYVGGLNESASSLRRLGTYSMIRGAVLYLAGAVKKGDMAMEDFGYCMEAAILKATELGIGTCWLAGSLSRSAFARRIGLKKDELIPAVTPLGYPGEKATLIVRTMGIAFGNKNRKDFGELFFDGKIDKPLTVDESGIFGKVLEAVRLGPSASNRQPWRIIRDGSQGDEYKYHFYLSENRMYNRAFGEVKIQNIDMGIAMCHFQFAARECGIKGAFVRDNPGINVGELLYIATWAALK